MVRLSIITCTYNSAAYLRETLESVRDQSFQDFEHIFIDGGSIDGTLEIIEEYKHGNKVLISESDRGIYDALNKGFALAKGDIVGIIHSDDVWADGHCLARVMSVFESQIDYYSARMGVYDELIKDKIATLGAPRHKFTWRDALYSSNYFAHPTVFIRKSLWSVVGEFNLRYRVAADIDWLWRLESVADKDYFDDFELVKMRHVGTSAKNYFSGLSEEFEIARKRFGLTPLVVFTYTYHFTRRALRFVLEFLGLVKVLSFFRKLINKYLK